MIGQLLADHVDADAVAEITREVLERVLDYPAVIAHAVGPYARRFGLERNDGMELLDELLRRAGAPNREGLIAEARQP